MRRLIPALALGFVLALLPSHGWAWTLVQQKAITPGTCSPSCTVDFDSNTTSNSLIVVAVKWQGTTTLTCSGDAATGWTMVAGSKLETLGDGLQWCYGLGNVGNTYTVEFSPGVFGGFAVAFEYTGNAVTSIQDQAGTGTGTGTNVTAGSLAPDTSNELLLVFGRNDSGNAGTWTKATSWTAIQYNPDVFHAVADYQGYPSTSATEFYLTFSSSTNWIASAVSFRPLDGGGCRGALMLMGVGGC